MTIRRLKELAKDGDSERYFVASLYISSGYDWSKAQELWEEAVMREANTRQVHNSLEKAERAAQKYLTNLLECISREIWPHP